MLRTREEEAGFLYEEGAKAVSAGGDELRTLASHLILMIRGTRDYQGPLWPLRVLPPDNREVRLTSFRDYLRKPVRVGLGAPSLHFLRQTLRALPNGDEALDLVRRELAKEDVNFDAVADRERDAALVKRKPSATGRPKDGTKIVPLSKGGADRQAAQLAARRPDLADRVRAGTLRLSAALIEAGIRKPPPDPLQALHKAWGKASAEQRASFLSTVAPAAAAPAPTEPETDEAGECYEALMAGLRALHARGDDDEDEELDEVICNAAFALIEVLEDETWRQWRREGRTYTAIGLVSFVVRRPPRGLGATMGEIEALIKSVPEATARWRKALADQAEALKAARQPARKGQRATQSVR